MSITERVRGNIIVPQESETTSSGNKRPAPSLRRGQRGEERRKELLQALQSACEPLLGSELAQQFGVSRQVLVQDIAILRASGSDVIATPRGYLIRTAEAAAFRDVIHVQHDRECMMDESSIFVDLGIRILDVAIDHPVLGRICVDLGISSRQDVQEIIRRMEETHTGALFELTGGRHSHTVEAPRPDLLEKACHKLQQRGYLAM